MKAKDLREKSTDDLKEMEKLTARGFFETRFKNFTNRLDDTSGIRKSRRELARIKTILGERARGAVPAAPVSKSAVAEGAAAPKAAKAKTPSAKVKAAAPKAKAVAEKPVTEKKTAKKTSKKSEAK
jgi:large subunit ribosomal protein L29